MIKVNISNTNKNRPIQASEIKRLALFTLGKVYRKRTGNINIVFLSDTGIKRLNRRFKKRDRATDVLCFCFDQGGMRFEDAGCEVTADIYISTDTAFSNASRYRNHFKKEIYLYVIHGILHMCGYTDGKPTARKKMVRKQEELLEQYETKKLYR